MVSDDVDDTFTGWVEDSDRIFDHWEVKKGGRFTIANDGVYFPEPIGYIDAEEKIQRNDIENYDVTVTFTNNPRRVFAPFLLSGTTFLYGYISGGEAAGLIVSVSVILFFLGVFGVLRELNRETAETIVTLEVGREEKEIHIDGNHGEKITELLNKTTTD
jgi:hypothetical protein